MELGGDNDQTPVFVKQEDNDVDFGDQNILQSSLFSDAVEHGDKLYNNSNHVENPTTATSNHQLSLLDYLTNRPDQRDLANVELEHARKRKKLSHSAHMRSQSFDVSLLSNIPKSSSSGSRDSNNHFFF